MLDAALLRPVLPSAEIPAAECRQKQDCSCADEQDGHQRQLNREQLPEATEDEAEPDDDPETLDSQSLGPASQLLARRDQANTQQADAPAEAGQDDDAKP